MAVQPTQVIYLAGGCFWGVEELFRRLPGVIDTQAGYANGSCREAVTYERVCQGDTGFKETVRIAYDKNVISLEQLLWAYFSIIDPTILNRQGNDRGTQYQTGIYWEPGDSKTAQQVQNIATKKRAELKARYLPFCVEVDELSNFYTAEEYHQHYLEKNPGGYCHVSRTNMDAILAALKS